MLSGTSIYIIYSVISILTSSIMAFLFWKRRSAIGAIPMSLLMIGTAEWALTDLISVLSNNFEAKVLWDNLNFISIVSVPVLWLIFSIQYTRQERFLKKKYYFLMAIIPALTLIMLFTQSLRPFFVFNTRMQPLPDSSGSYIVYDFGIWFWVHTIYSYALIISGIIILIRRLLKFHRVYQKQALAMISAVIIPLIGECLYILGLGPFKYLDMTSYTFSITGLLLFIGMFRYKILDLIPIARDAVIDSMDDLLMVIDTKNRIIDINNSAKNIFSKKYGNLIGRPISEILGNSLSLSDEASVSSRINEEIILEIDNNKIYYNMETAPLLSKRNKIVGRFVVLDNITELKETMKELENSKILAESANRAKSEFLAKMSHEIRTPISGIIGMAELLESASLTSQEKENLDALQYSAESLLHIINEILDFSKIEAGKMEVESTSFNLRDLIFNISKVFSSGNKPDHVDFIYNIDDKVPENIAGDYAKLRQIIFNLLSNAFKFTEKGKVRMTVDNIKSFDDKVLLRFSVSDTGIGISPDKIKDLFQSFHQLDSSTTRKYGGTGLGLSIVKNLVELMGGSIRVESQEGKGSRFIFEIPFIAAQNNISPVTQPSPSCTYTENTDNKLCILVAEDSRVNQMVVSQYLEKKKWTVDIAENGREVLQKLEANTYDLILMDIQMPEMDGYEAAKLIREKEKGTGNHVPIIALTANATENDKIKCSECGMEDFLPKPIRSEKLYAAVLKYTTIRYNRELLSKLNIQ